ncbi:MAG: hypothetical protein JST21_16485 [Bacteroidetes bacterium]|nr:hypothetical protein [Bacteroidota bacterium]
MKMIAYFSGNNNVAGNAVGQLPVDWSKQKSSYFVDAINLIIIAHFKKTIKTKK